MAERVLPPSGDDDDNNNNNNNNINSGQIQPLSQQSQQQQQTTLCSGTYVVQVPKDQVYRVPTPQQAEIADRHRNNAQRSKNKTCCSCCCCFSVLVVVLVVLGIASIVFSVFLKHKDPVFYVESLTAVNGSRSDTKNLRQDYRMRLKVVNSNKKIDILYKEGGEASLCFRKQEIALGKYPTFFQHHKNTTTFDLVLHGSDVVLPKEMEKSMKNGSQKVHVFLSLNMKIPVRMKLWKLKTGSKKFGVACDVMVDTLAKGTRILSQECNTKRL
ncbi:hypothetical protein FEM48_Zijuj06G0117300 [Ziziphus jujuba var. spinosa]|uniref:NDR1/HIN1-like protein 13 n=1 Tax=Ziziphus jujuba var. spinosa TaxID=714518 RepID=A0A978V935_ZIZJJ|nr:hypothetical protein FEM48_Zijuj06G0117300 [Ziziphus jujuba var. spinosa]